MGTHTEKDKKQVNDRDLFFQKTEVGSTVQNFLIYFTLDKDRLSNFHGFDSCFRRQPDHPRIFILFE